VEMGNERHEGSLFMQNKCRKKLTIELEIKEVALRHISANNNFAWFLCLAPRSLGRMLKEFKTGS